MLDVQSAEGRYHNEQIFYLVFEHMDQDLDQFIRDCPSPGMNETLIRVSRHTICMETHTSMMLGIITMPISILSTTVLLTGPRDRRQHDPHDPLDRVMMEICLLVAFVFLVMFSGCCCYFLVVPVTGDTTDNLLVSSRMQRAPIC